MDDKDRFTEGDRVGLVMVKEGEDIVDISFVLEEALILRVLKDIPGVVAMLMGLLFALNISRAVEVHI